MADTVSKTNKGFITVASVLGVIVLFVLVRPDFSKFGTTDPFVEVSCEELETSETVTKQLTVDEGENFSLFTCGDPSTGHRWSNPFLTDQQLVEFVKTEFVVNHDVVDVETADVGKRRWKGKAVATGTATFHSEYRIPGADSAVKTVDLVLTVE